MGERLIDANALRDLVSDMLILKEKYGVNFDILSVIDNAPTIHHPDCDNCEDKAKQYSLGFQDGYLTGKERPQGEWIKKIDDVGFISHICSNCGSEIEVEDPCDDKFCFSCGARMGVKKND